MGVVNIDDESHANVRKASIISCRSINAQAAFWIKIGMLAEMNPTLSFNEIMNNEFLTAGISADNLSKEIFND
ncbi:ParD-like family protein [Acinetobacter baumannii]|uniref:ParD-like family protein n=1 Tax=Acinetobacter baumannii TaxID=470 RepID=UPI000425942C|nr:ParD-like family protein [Acinetobacter baumannii]EKT8144864.1 ParD-like family protein [Acinetobacter baumannii]EKU7086628.1 ParD-like family protein [Acinetobacter baumannii]EKV1043378.1 ParD-like family protein [Acinetobacter baumannii]EKV1046968.1 ParD-like family protein [Acinetobacter baumannii]EKV1920744.1 ParD-like family protein [Acinetobacter baumannii]